MPNAKLKIARMRDSEISITGGAAAGTVGIFGTLPPPPSQQIGKKGVLIFYLVRRLDIPAGGFRYGW